MHDMDRDQVLSQIYRRLTDREFASRLKAVDGEGNAPIVAAVASTPFRTVLDEVAGYGGQANVVAAVFDGLLIFRVEDGVTERDSDEHFSLGDIDMDCTVGVLVARMIADGGDTHVFRCVDTAGASHAARADAASLMGSM